METIAGGLRTRLRVDVSERVVGIVLLALLASAVVFGVLAPSWVLAVVPGCWFHRITGWNCPFCGMTRDFIGLLHGNLNLHNPCSVPVFVLLFAVYPVVNVLTLLGRIRPPRVAVREKVVLLALIGMFVLNNLTRFGG